MKRNPNRDRSIIAKVALGGLLFVAIDLSLGMILTAIANRIVRRQQEIIWDTAASRSADDDL